MILGCLLRMEEEWRRGERPWKTAVERPWKTAATLEDHSSAGTSHGASQTREAKVHKQLASKSTSSQSRADQSQDYIQVADHGSTEAGSPTDLLARARAVEARTKDMKSITLSSVQPCTASSVLHDLLNFNGSIACPTTHAPRPSKSPFRPSASETTPEVCTSETLESGMPKSRLSPSPAFF